MKPAEVLEAVRESLLLHYISAFLRKASGYLRPERYVWRHRAYIRVAAEIKHRIPPRSSVYGLIGRAAIDGAGRLRVVAPKVCGSGLHHRNDGA